MSAARTLSEKLHCEAIDEAILEAMDNLDPWHPASEPPKPEDFEPTGKVLIWHSEYGLNFAPIHGKGLFGYSHWKRVTPPKPLKPDNDGKET